MPRRPLCVTLFALLVLALALLNGIRAWAAIAQREALAEFAARPGPWYLATTGLFWLAVGLPLYTGLALGRNRARIASIFAVPAYLLYYWVDRLWLRAGPVSANWPFMLAVSAACVALAAMALLSRPARQFFDSESTEHTGGRT